MRSGADAKGDGLSGTELQSKLREEKEICALLQSESDSELADKYRRECSSLHDNVARLEVDCEVLRERGVKDRERIRNLVEEIHKKGRDFKEKFAEVMAKNRELESCNRRALDEVQEWKKKYEHLKADTFCLSKQKFYVEWLEMKQSDLEDRKGKLEMENKELKDDLECGKKKAEDDVREWKEKYVELEAQLMRFGEDSSVLLETERKRNEKTEEEFDQLKKQYDVLYCAKTKVEDEVCEWKMKCRELEAQASGTEEDNSRLRDVENRYGVLISDKKATKDEVHEWKRKHGEVEARALKLEEENSKLGEIKGSVLYDDKNKLEGEVQVWKKKCREAEARAMKLEEGNLKVKEIERNGQKLKDKVEAEVHEWKKRYRELEAQELELQNKFLHLIEIQRKENELKEEIFHLDMENNDLGHFKKKAGEEIHEWRKRCQEVKSRVPNLLETDWKKEESTEKFVQLEVESNERMLEDEVHQWKRIYQELKAQALNRSKGQANTCFSSAVSDESILDLMKRTDEELANRTEGSKIRLSEKDHLCSGESRKRPFC